MRKIEIGRILENGMNPRNFDESRQREKLTRLIKSIMEVGLTTPPVLYRKAGTRFFAPLDGHRRIRACRELGWSEIPYIWTKDMGLPESMTDAEALKYMFEGQGATEAWKSKDMLEVVGSAIDRNEDFCVPKKMDDMKTVYGLSPAWLRELMRKGDHSRAWEKRGGLGWTIARDILKYTTDERSIRVLVDAYLGRAIKNQRHLNEVIKQLRAGGISIPDCRAKA